MAWTCPSNKWTFTLYDTITNTQQTETLHSWFEWQTIRVIIMIIIYNIQYFHLIFLFSYFSFFSKYPFTFPWVLSPKHLTIPTAIISLCCASVSLLRCPVFIYFGQLLDHLDHIIWSIPMYSLIYTMRSHMGQCWCAVDWRWWQIGWSVTFQYHSTCSTLHDHRYGHKFVVVQERRWGWKGICHRKLPEKHFFVRKSLFWSTNQICSSCISAIVVIYNLSSCFVWLCSFADLNHVVRIHLTTGS